MTYVHTWQVHLVTHRDINKEVKTPIYLGEAMHLSTSQFNELCIRYWKHINQITLSTQIHQAFQNKYSYLSIIPP